MPLQLPSFFSQVMSKSATVLFEAFNEASVEIHPEYALEGGLWQPNCSTGMPCSRLVEMLRGEGARVGLGLLEVINHNQKVAKWVRRLTVEGMTSVNNIVDLLHRDA